MKTKGWRDVFAFTFLQTIKTKSFIISTVIFTLLLSLVMVGANLLPAFFSSEEQSDGGNQSGQNEFKASTVYLLDESGLSEFNDMLPALSEGCKITFEKIEAAKLGEYTQKVYNSTAAEILLQITKEEYGYQLYMSRPYSSDVINDGDCNMILSALGSAMDSAKLISLGVSADDLAAAKSTSSMTLTIAGEKPTSPVKEVIDMIVPMLSSLILFMFIFIYGQMVAQSIAIEKTSRVMELLLTSIRPLAVIIGKVLAMCCVSFGQLALIGSVSGGIFAVTMPFGMLNKLSQATDAASKEILGSINEAFSAINPATIIGIIILFLLGFLFFALIAGLVGASISRMEDLTSAMQPFAIIGVIGFYLAYMPGLGDYGQGQENPITVFSRYFPISSPFALPSAMILGKVSAVEVIMSTCLLAVCVALLAMLVAKVYENIILHSGNPLKITQIIKMAKKS